MDPQLQAGPSLHVASSSADSKVGNQDPEEWQLHRSSSGIAQADSWVVSHFCGWQISTGRPRSGGPVPPEWDVHTCRGLKLVFVPQHPSVKAVGGIGGTGRCSREWEGAPGVLSKAFQLEDQTSRPVMCPRCPSANHHPCRCSQSVIRQ